MLIYTLLLSGVTTFLIGVLPEYATINIWAPIALLVLRFAQGFAVGDEWGGAVLMAVERAPKESRGYDASWPLLGVPVGLFLSSVVFLPIPPPQAGQALGWAWRVPFLLSIVLVAVGIFIRRAIINSRVFIELTEKFKVPLLDTFRRHRREALLAIGAKIGENGVFYFYTTFARLLARKYTTYTDAPLPRNTLFSATMLAAVLLMLTIPVFATLLDHVGRRRVYLMGAIFAGLLAFRSLWMIKTALLPLVMVAVVCALALGWAAMYAPQASFFPELFGTGVRYSGALLGGQFATIFVGGWGPSLP
jgi:MFS family permease